jgi:hypothetical protein
MPEGDHLFRTSWGYWGLNPQEGREPDRTLLKALGFKDETGAWTVQGKSLLDLGSFRSATEPFHKDRQRMIGVCAECHEKSLAEETLARGDRALSEANQLMARALEAAERRGMIGPILIPTGDEGSLQSRLQEMFFSDRMNGFKGRYHLSPHYSEDLGLKRMESGISEIELSSLPLLLQEPLARQIR